MTLEASGKAAVTTYADKAYVEAIGALHVNPQIVAVLSPMAKSLYDLGVKVIEDQAGQILTDVGGKVMEAATEAIGTEAAQAIAGVASTIGDAVGDIVPVVNLVLSFYSIVSIPMKASGAEADRRTQKFFDQGALSGSDYNLGVNAADIFAPIASDGDLGFTGYYWNRPKSLLGACLAAVTEDNIADLKHAGLMMEDGRMTNGPSTGLEIALATDSNLHHATEYWFIAQTGLAPDLLGIGGAVSPNQGHIPGPRRAVYRALRTAMGARGHDQGAALLPIYLDMLLEDWDAGFLDAQFMASMIYSTVYGTTNDANVRPVESVAGSGSVNRPGCIAIPLDQLSGLVSPMVELLDHWRKTKKSVPPMVLHFGDLTSFWLKRALKMPWGPNLVAAVASLSPTEQAVVLQAAYRKSFVKIPIHINAGLLKGLFK